MTDAPQKLTVEEIDAFERIAIREMGIVGLTEAVCALARRAVSQEGTEDATTHTVIMTADRIAEDICNDFDLDMEYVPLVAEHLYEAIAERDKLKEEVAYEKRCRDANQKAYHDAIERVSELEGALTAIAFASGDQPAAMNIPEEDWYRSRFYDCVTTASAALSRTSEEA
jgi:hypothetical protein